MVVAREEAAVRVAAGLVATAGLAESTVRVAGVLAVRVEPLV